MKPFRFSRHSRGFLLAVLGVLTPLCGCAGAPNTTAAPRPDIFALPSSAPSDGTLAVDEPLGPSASSGLTLWHLGHIPARVREFHAYLHDKGVNPADVAAEAVPDRVTRILVDFGDVPPDARGDWKTGATNELRAPGDTGKPAKFPLRIARSGTYHLWLQYRGAGDGISPTALKLYRRGQENLSPAWTDEFADRALAPDNVTQNTGDLAWHDVLVTLDAGDYTAWLAPIPKGWRSHYDLSKSSLREFHCLYLTEELGASAPDEAMLQTMRSDLPTSGLIQHDDSVALSAPQKTRELAWRARPLDWNEAAAQPRLWQLSLDFWSRTMAQIAAQPISNTLHPRDAERQIIFDPAWNLVGTPHDIAQKVSQLQGEADPQRDSEHARSLGWAADHNLIAWWGTDPGAPNLTLEPSSDKTWPGRATSDIPPLRLALARDSFGAARLQLRNLGKAEKTLRVTIGDLHNDTKTFADKVNWRVVAFAPRRTDITIWFPWALLRRPFVTIQPGVPVALWITVNTRGLPPGDYQTKIRWGDYTGRNEKLSGSAQLKVHVSPVRIAPRQPILMGGFGPPPEGDDYQSDAVRHGFNIGYRPMSKAEMSRLGLKLLSLGVAAIIEPKSHAQLDQLRAGGLDWSDFILTVSDEPSGRTPQELSKFINVANRARAIEPRAQLSFNPRDTATPETFQILDPLCDWWITYVSHADALSARGSAERAIFTRKPWMFYRVAAYDNDNPILPNMMRSYIRSVPGRANNCRGAAFYTLFVPGHDAWDNARKEVRDEAVLVLPGRFGPVPIVAYETVQQGWQDASLARMVKEANGPATLISDGSTDELLRWLESHK